MCMYGLRWADTANGQCGATLTRSFRFHARIQSGMGYSNVVVEVDAATVLSLAEARKVAGNASHAAWHHRNADSAYPCSSCSMPPNETF